MDAKQTPTAMPGVRDVTLGLLFAFVSCFGQWTVLSAAVQAAGDLPKVLVIGTGGTIAGEHPEPGTLGMGYRTERSASDLVGALPLAAQYADVEAEQFINVGSTSVTPEHWLGLAHRINEVFVGRPDVAGVVVTHGTASLEQTAFFLHLTVKSERPVVVVGAQRPPTGVGPDGPHNLLSAIRVAASPNARNRGVMVVMDGRIQSARDVEKLCRRPGCFDTGAMGVLGMLSDDRVDGVGFYYTPVKKHTAGSDFDVSMLTELPRVHITYSYAGAERDLEQDMPHPDVEAIISTTTGFAPGEREYYTELRRQGIIVATTYPSGEEMRISPLPDDDVPRVVTVLHLTPVKARILMMLALTKTRSADEIQEIFHSY